MKRHLVLLLSLLVSYIGHTQPDTLLLTRNLPEATYEFNPYLYNWRFHEGDSMEWAMPYTVDSDWQIVNSKMDSGVGGKSFYQFSSIGWFRLHVNADTSILHIPLAFTINQFGASEIYLDGVMIGSFGYPSTPDSTQYFHTKSGPAYFTFSRSGHHVFAVRYAAYNAALNAKKYAETQRGFIAEIVTAAAHMRDTQNRTIGTTFLGALLSGIFAALALSHLLLFLYHRSQPSNLYFSLFCMSVSGTLLVLWFGTHANYPIFDLSRHYTMPVLISLICLALSGFVNYLFSKSRARFRIIVVASVLASVLYWLISTVYPYLLLALAVLIEAIVLILRGIIQKVKGAHIIGTGFLLFALFMGFNISYLLIFRQDLTIDDGSALQFVFIVFGGLSVLSLPFSMSMFLAWNFADVNRALQNNLNRVQALSEQTIAQELEKNRIIEGQKEALEKEVIARTGEVVAQKERLQQQHNELKNEKAKSDQLLLNILPGEIAEELKETGQTVARQYHNVSVLFTDFVGFTQAAEKMTPQELVDELHVCFRTFDEIISRYRIEKIKTIGDAYLAICGLPQPDEQHAINTVKAAIEIRNFMQERRARLGDKTFEIRIGINSGSVVAGIVGIKKFAYDIWGDTVNIAARMESGSERGKINISESTWQLVHHAFICTDRGLIGAKHKGEMRMYFVEAPM
jgi:class 3 adenylate cyclase